MGHSKFGTTPKNYLAVKFKLKNYCYYIMKYGFILHQLKHCIEKGSMYHTDRMDKYGWSIQNLLNWSNCVNKKRNYFSFNQPDEFF